MTTRITVRRLTVAERSAARSLRLNSLLDAPDAFDSLHADAVVRPDEWWDDWLTSSATFAASLDTRDVGIVRVQPLESEPDDIAMVYSMWVDPSARGLGVGEALVEECVRWADHVGLEEVQLAVVERNVHAIALYERLGFRPTGHVEIRERDNARVLEMCRAISPEKRSSGSTE